MGVMGASGGARFGLLVCLVSGAIFFDGHVNAIESEIP